VAKGVKNAETYGLNEKTLGSRDGSIFNETVIRKGLNEPAVIARIDRSLKGIVVNVVILNNGLLFGRLWFDVGPR
jgi:hypothetical protein